MFLERYFVVLDLLRGPDDFSLAAERYLDLAVSQGVVHVEFHVSATGHIVEQGKDWGPIYDGKREDRRRRTWPRVARAWWQSDTTGRARRCGLLKTGLRGPGYQTKTILPLDGSPVLHSEGRVAVGNVGADGGNHAAM
jgi:hypothetical protein